MQDTERHSERWHGLSRYAPVLGANLLPVLALWLLDWSPGRFYLCLWFELVCIVFAQFLLAGAADRIRMAVSGTLYLALALVVVAHGLIDPDDRNLITQFSWATLDWPHVELALVLIGIAVSYGLDAYRQRRTPRRAAAREADAGGAALVMLSVSIALIFAALFGRSFPIPDLVPLMVAGVKLLAELAWLVGKRQHALSPHRRG